MGVLNRRGTVVVFDPKTTPHQVLQHYDPMRKIYRFELEIVDPPVSRMPSPFPAAQKPVCTAAERARRLRVKKALARKNRKGFCKRVARKDKKCPYGKISHRNR